MTYLDHAATTSLDPRVAQTWLNATQTLGNANSLHTPGRAARSLLEDARETVADVVGCDPHEVIFTSGGTEADNLAVSGLYRGVPVAYSTIEHPAVGESARLHRTRVGTPVWEIPVGETGVVVPDDVRSVLDQARMQGEPVGVVSVMAANNETGLIQPIQEIAQVVRAAGAAFHTDAVQAIGLIDIDFSGLDAMTISGHKIGAPVGVGALIARRDFPLEALEGGGGQERKVRSGTINVAGAVALAESLRIAAEERAEKSARLGALSERLAGGLLAAIPDSSRSGAGERLVSHVHLLVPGADPEALLLGCDMAGLAISLGSACRAGVQRYSEVLAAMGLGEVAAVRLTLGATSTDADVDHAISALPGIVEVARKAGRRRG